MIVNIKSIYIYIYINAGDDENYVHNIYLYIYISLNS